MMSPHGSPKLTVPSYFSGIVSGQDWSGPGSLFASLGSDTHTAVPCVFTPLAPPVDLRVLPTLHLHAC